jgi:hypothetical protein
VQTQGCSEGGLNVDYIANGSYVVYSNLDLNGVGGFQARVASAGSGGNIQIRLDSPTGTMIGSCAVPVTGGWQTWTTVSCALSGASGYHNVFLVFAGGGGYLLNLEWFSFQPQSNTIPQIVPLSLQSVFASQGLTLQWPDNGSADVSAQTNLYYTSDLTPAALWAPVTNTPVYSNGQWTVTLPIGTSNAGFYRLQ